MFKDCNSGSEGGSLESYVAKSDFKSIHLYVDIGVGDYAFAFFRMAFV